MNKVVVRTISGVIYIALIVGAILGGAPWFTALMCLFAALGVIEFEGVLSGRPVGSPAVIARVYDVVAAVALVSFAGLFYMPTALIFTLIGLITMYLPVRLTLALYDKNTTSFRNVADSILALVYIALPLFLLTMVYTDRPSNHLLVLAAFIMIWVNDTGAFCVGSLWGKRRLFERLSPKKSWEGFVGGLMFCLLTGILFYYVMPALGYSLVLWLLIGLVVCVLSTWGDLFESLFKRSNHVKDSGHLIPGHGGILDRIDSLLFVSMGLFIFTLIF